jgi:restriction endonuclease Mrr
MIDQALREHHRERSHAASPLRGVSTEEVLAALPWVLSPPELDWELVGVVFVHADIAEVTLAHLPVEMKVVEQPPWAAEPEPIADFPPPTPAAREVAPRKTFTWLPEHDEIMAAVRDLSWEGYRSLIADMFRRAGYEVFDGEGADGDVIDMEVVRGTQRMLVNCQLRGMSQIAVEPIDEMAQVALRNGADGVFIVTDGDFAPEARMLADARSMTLIDREDLLNLVLDFTIGAGRERSLSSQVRRLLAGAKAQTRQLGGLTIRTA